MSVIHYEHVNITKDQARDAVVRVSIADDPLIEIQFFEDDDGSLYIRITELTEDDAYEHSIENNLPEYWDN